MLIDVKVKATEIVAGKEKKVNATYVADKETFAEAESLVKHILNEDMEQGTLGDYEVTGLKYSIIKEIVNPKDDDKQSFIATLKCSYTDEKGKEKSIRYKILLWADTIESANTVAANFVLQGYDMLLEGIKQVNYNYVR